METGAERQSQRTPEDYREVQALARKYKTEAIEALVQILRDKRAPPAARAVAANSILDRGYGRPAQSVDVAINKPVEEMSDVAAS